MKTAAGLSVRLFAKKRNSKTFLHYNIIVAIGMLWLFFFNIVPMFGIVSTIVVMGILGLGNVLNAGFDQIFNLYSPLVYSTGDILDTWVYRMGLLNVQFSLATAAGLFKSAISFLLIVISYVIAYKAADYRIF